MPTQGNPPRIPLVSALANRDTTTLTDSKMVNSFIEKDGQRLLAVKRSGLSMFQQNAVGVGQGLYNFQDDLYSITNDTLNLNKQVTAGFSTVSNGAGFSPRVDAAVVGFGGKLWVMGGMSTVNGVNVCYNDVYASLDGVSWNKVTSSAPWGPRYGAKAVVFNNLLFLMGGCSTDSPALNYGDVWVTSNGKDWTLLDPSAWPGRKDFGATVFQNKLWIAGGRAQQTDASGNQTGYYNDVWSSVDGQAWVQVTSNANWLPRSRFGFAGFNGKLIVLGGEFSSIWQGAAVDLWTSVDGNLWTRNSSNPFSQGNSSIFNRAVLTSIGTGFWSSPPSVTLIGGGGSGATGIVTAIGTDDDDEDESGYIVTSVIVNNPGSGYTFAPAMSFSGSVGVNLSAYSLLAANGTAGDKRGMFAQSGQTLYFFATMNGGQPSNEIWQSTDGIAWSLSSNGTVFSPRDAYVIAYGPFWLFGGKDASGTYYNDVWTGNLTASSVYPLSVIVPNLNYSFAQTSISINTPLIFFKTTDDAFSFAPGSSTLTKVSGPGTNYPPKTVPGVVYLDGYFFVMDPGGTIYNSAINDPGTWTALGAVKAQAEPNAGVATAKVQNYVLAMGVWSLTFFYDAALPAPGSPLAPNDTLAAIVGCANGYSVVEMQNTVVWVGQSKKEGRGVYILDNFYPIKISSPFIDRIVQADDLSDVRAYATEMSGHSFYVLTLARSNVTLVYDFHSAEWAVWTSRQPTSTIVIQSLSCNAYGLVTAVAEAHGLSDGDPITVATASVDGYNGPTNVSVIDNNTFTYTVEQSLPPAQGVAQAIRTSEGYFYCRNSAQVKGVNYLQHESNGNIFRFSPDAFLDFGNPIDVRVVTNNWDGGSRARYKFPGTVDILADNVPSKALLRYTKDDFKSWSKFRSVDLSLTRSRVTRLARFHRIAFQLRHTAATGFRAEALELSIEEGT